MVLQGASPRTGQKKKTERSLTSLFVRLCSSHGVKEETREGGRHLRLRCLKSACPRKKAKNMKGRRGGFMKMVLLSQKRSRATQPPT